MSATTNFFQLIGPRIQNKLHTTTISVSFCSPMSPTAKEPCLPLVNTVVLLGPDHAQQRASGLKAAKIAAAAALGLFALSQSCAPDFIGTRLFAPPLGFPEKIQRQWGQYSPYFPAGKYIPPPSSCSITQVNIVSRFVNSRILLLTCSHIATTPRRSISQRRRRL